MSHGDSLERGGCTNGNAVRERGRVLEWKGGTGERTGNVPSEGRMSAVLHANQAKSTGGLCLKSASQNPKILVAEHAHCRVAELPGTLPI